MICFDTFLQIHSIDQVVPVRVRGEVPLPAWPPELPELAGQPHRQEGREEAPGDQGEDGSGGGLDLGIKKCLCFLFIVLFFFLTSRVLSFRAPSLSGPLTHLCDLQEGYGGDGLQSWWGSTGI